jgi:hypothetical protein
MDRLRLLAASTVLAIPAAVFALNALISFRERGLVERFDVPAAVALAALAVLVWRGVRLALVSGAALIVAYLVTAAAGGLMPFVAYWAVALVLTLQALPITREVGARSAV